MIRIFPRRRAEIRITSGLDRVMFGISLPSDCRLNGLTATVHLVGEAPLTNLQAAMYGVEGYILPILDPDSSPTFDTVWDTLVPKDNDTDTIDLDTASADSQSFFEPGEMAMAEVMDVGLQPERIYNMQRMKSFADAPFKQEISSVLEWVLTDTLKIRVRKRYAVRQPSVVAFGIAMPAMDDTTATVISALAENEWPRVKYIGTVLEQALMKHFGLVETGAETPWEDAAILLRKYLEPDVHEEDSAAWASPPTRVFCNVTFDVSVPGTMEQISIGSGG